jgi:hypothetical protein
VDPRDRANYVNREVSLLAFTTRVLEQAKDPTTPLLERLRFLCISSTNLDEFFEIRVGGLKQQLAVGGATPGPDGLSAQEQLDAHEPRRRTRSSPSSTAPCRRSSSPRSPPRGSASCAARTGRRRSRSGSRPTSTARCSRS